MDAKLVRGCGRALWGGQATEDTALGEEGPAGMGQGAQ